MRSGLSPARGRASNRLGYFVACLKNKYKRVGSEYRTMTKVNEVYLCEICGNKVKVLESGAGTLVCCGEDMVKVAK